MITMSSNPYYEIYLNLSSHLMREHPREYELWRGQPFRTGCHFSDCEARVGRNREFQRIYSWAVPDEQALTMLSDYGNTVNGIVEVGAGTGYWASLLAARTPVVAYDVAPPRPDSRENVYHGGMQTWYPVERGDSQSVRNHSDKMLFLCWPPYQDMMAFETLMAYYGDLVAYVGEGEGGCTGTDNFHDRLRLEWDVEATHHIPQWAGLHDYLTIYRRKTYGG